MLKLFIFLPLASILLCAGLGLFTFTRNPRHPANIGFFLGMLSLVVMECGSALLFSSLLKGSISTTGIYLVFTGQAILPLCWLAFSSVFGRADPRRAILRWLPVIVLMVPVVVYFVVYMPSEEFLSIGYDTSGLAVFIFGQKARYFYIYLVIALVINLVHLENVLRSSKGIKRWQIKYVIFGVGAILAFFIYLSSQILLFHTLTFVVLPVVSTVIIISTVLMGVFIVRHRLLDVDVFISRYVVYNSLTVLVVGAYLLIVGILTKGIMYFGVPFNYFFTTLFVFVAILLLVILLFATTLRRKIQLFINRHFYSHKYEFRDKWMETIERMSSKRSVDEVHTTLIDMISETMGASNVALWLYNPATRDFVLTRGGNSWRYKRIPRAHPFLKYIRSMGAPFLLKDISLDGISPEERQEIEGLIKATGAVLCTPLVAGNDMVGFMLQGEDISGYPYIRDDFEFLKAVSTQAAIQIKNILLTQDLLTAKELDMFNRMSSFIMHDLKNLTNSLSLISQNARHNIDNPEFQKDAIRTIDSTVARMKGLIERLSMASKGFEIRKQGVNLKDLVHKAIEKMAFNGSKNVIITNEIDPVLLISVDPEAMEMVLLNLISNAYEAIEREGRIRISASVDGDNVRIEVTDNGSGMDEDFVRECLFKPFRSTKKKGFGIGLYQCKTIIEAHRGSIDVSSREGQGTTFTITLPLGAEGGGQPL